MTRPVIPDAVSTDVVRIESSSAWAGSWKKSAAIGLVALAASAYGATREPERFAHSYLFAFFVFLSVPLGALFFVLLQYLTKAGWSVTVRRSSELLMAGMPVFLLLVVPILLHTSRLYPWDGAPHEQETTEAGAFANADDEGNREPAALAAANREITQELTASTRAEEATIMQGRKPYLNRPFFVLRALAFLGLWSWIALRLFRWSTAQDETGTVDGTVRAQRFAPAATVLLAITTQFAAVDWLMSLDPTWYSSVFGVYVFAGATAAHAAALILFTKLLQRSGLLRSSISVEHYHDLGKFLFGWVSFWAYIAFAQFFLIWYANVPDEVTFFHQRWTDNLGSWKPFSLALFVLHFLVPFWLLLSRNAKRNGGILGFGALLILALHAVDIYWIVLPHLGAFRPHWLDATCWLGVGGVYAAAVLRAMEAHALIPLGDPRLARALSFENS